MSKTSSLSFTDCNNGNIIINSTWKQSKKSVSSISCQTSDNLWEFMDNGMQTGIYNENMEYDVTEKDSDRSLFKYLSSIYKYKDDVTWKQDIIAGKVRVDNEIITDPEFVIKTDNIVEYISAKSNMETQTEQQSIIPYSPPVSPTAGTKNKKFDFDFNDDNDEKEGSKYDDDDNDDDDDLKESKDDSRKSQSNNRNSSNVSSLDKFLHKVFPVFSQELDSNANSKAFDGYEIIVDHGSDDHIKYWKTLSVDLEKKKVLFPDWTKAKYYMGQILKTFVTRNKERIYDVEYDDGAKLYGVREEYIRVICDSKRQTTEFKSVAKSGIRLQEGQRVHARRTLKGGADKFVPGRVVKSIRGSTYDIECEGGSTQYGMSGEDIMVGLEEGMSVEARRPSQIRLQCTDIAWTCTGNTIAASYGRLDISGWCDYPGALCLWNIFSKSFNAEEPDYVLDHTSCLMCISCHPQKPSIVAAGSYNGEVIVWDITAPEQPIGISPILEYTHKDYVTSLSWTWDSVIGGGEWLIVSTSVDGKILFWSLSNGLKHPVRGVSLGLDVSEGSRRKYPSAHGAKSFSFSRSSPSLSSVNKPQWLVVGQEGGALVRVQTSKILSQRVLTKDVFRSYSSSSSSSELYPSAKKWDESFAHDSHIGPVNDVDASPFHRNVFLTAGSDGVLKLFHMLEKTPLHQWEPAPPPGTGNSNSNSNSGNSNSNSNSKGGGGGSATVSLTSAKFSPNRPLVFAATSSDGFLYLFDLRASSLAPVAMLEAPSSHNSNSNSSGLTGVAFNTKQREFIAACDYLGNIHIWKLNFDLASSSSSQGGVAGEVEKLKGLNVGKE